MRNKLLALGVTGLGIAAAGAGLYRATHPEDGRSLDDGPSGPRQPIDPGRFVMPADVTEHDLPTRDGGSIHVVEMGEGRPLLLLHGITLRSDVWAPQFHQLADRFRVIAVDLRGHGRSRPGTDGYGLGPLADDLATVLEGLDLRDAIVVGHSMGGMTVMQFCGAHPEVLAARVAGLVLVATRAHKVVPPYVDRAARALVDQGQHRLDDGRGLPARATVNNRIARLAFGDHPSPEAVRILAEMGQSMAPEALMPSVSGLLEHDARAALARTDTPSVVVVGTRDVLTPVPSGRHLAHLLPDADFVVLRRCGHQVMQERPDELAEILRAFDRRLAGAVGTVAEAVEADPGPLGADDVDHDDAAVD